MSQTRFAWKGGTTIPVKADIAGAEIERLRKTGGGYVAPVSLIEASRPQDAPLHDAFEWNDTKAAIAHRIEQARYIIRSVVVVDPDKPRGEYVRAFVSIIPPDADSPSYTRLSEAMAKPDLREQVLGDALRDMHAFERKYQHLAEIAEVIAAMTKVRSGVEKKIPKAA